MSWRQSKQVTRSKVLPPKSFAVATSNFVLPDTPCVRACSLACSIEVQPLDLVKLRGSIDDVQRASAELHTAVTVQYFAAGAEV